MHLIYEMVFMIMFSLVLSLIITPITIRIGIMDIPDERKIHDRAIAKAGGIGIFIPVIILEILEVYRRIIVRGFFIRGFSIIIIITLLLMILGIVDDIFDLNSKLKLVIHFLASLITVFAGIRFSIFGLLIPDTLLTILWISVIINAVNLIDGLDGLAAGVAVISCIGFFSIGILYNSDIIAFLSTIIIGSCLGFLRYNFRPAKIFMGDTGSIPLGYNLAIIGILCQKLVAGNLVISKFASGTALIIPILILGIPIYDLLLSIFRRLLNGKPIFNPDRHHFYNTMIDVKKLDYKKTVLIIYLACLILSCVSILLIFLNNLFKIIAFCLLVVGAIFLSYNVNFIRNNS